MKEWIYKHRTQAIAITGGVIGVVAIIIIISVLSSGTQDKDKSTDVHAEISTTKETTQKQSDDETTTREDTTSESGEEETTTEAITVETDPTPLEPSGDTRGNENITDEYISPTSGGTQTPASTNQTTTRSQVTPQPTTTKKEETTTAKVVHGKNGVITDELYVNLTTGLEKIPKTKAELVEMVGGKENTFLSAFHYYRTVKPQILNNSLTFLGNTKRTIP